MDNEFERTSSLYDSEARNEYRGNFQRDSNNPTVKKHHNNNFNRRREESNEYPPKRYGGNKRPVDDRFVKRRRDEDPKRNSQHPDEEIRRGPNQRNFNPNKQGFEPKTNRYENQRFYSSGREAENGNEKGPLIDRDRKRKLPQQRQKRKICRDYEGKGFCVRADQCPYEHGRDKIIVDNPSKLRGRPVSPSNADFDSEKAEESYRDYTPKKKPKRDDYRDRDDFNEREKEGDLSPNEITGADKSSEYVERKHKDSGRGGRGYTPYSKDRNFNGSKQQRRTPFTNTSLMIKNIPHELNTITHLNDHFKNFGTIVDIKTMLPQNQALVRFQSRAEALKGLQSPAAVFGNRFIKVFWARGEANEGQTDEQKDGNLDGETEVPRVHPIMKGPFVHNNTNMSLKIPHEQPSPFPKASPNKLSQQEILKEIQRHKDQLMKKQMAQQEQLLEILEKKKDSLTPKERATIMEEIKAINEQISSSLKKHTSALETTIRESESTFLRAKEREKERLDRELELIVHPAPKEHPLAHPSNSHEETTSSAVSSDVPPVHLSSGTAAPILQVGRGRGLFRGRGLSSRGAAPRGRLLRGERSLVLDNRPTSLIVSALPPDLLNEETLKSHFQSFGEVRGLTLKDKDAVVTFTTRKSAETAFLLGRQLKSETLQLSWCLQRPDVIPPKKENQEGEEEASLHDQSDDSLLEDYEEFLDDDKGERSWKHV